MPPDVQGMAVYLLALVVGVLGWLATHLVARPYLVYRALRAEIARSLVHFSRVDGLASVGNGYEWPEAVQARTRALEFVGELEACKATIAFYDLWAKLRLVRTRKDIEIAKANLRGLSRCIGVPGKGSDNSRREDKIREALGLL